MKHKSYDRYFLRVLLILSLEVGILFSRVETFGFERRVPQKKMNSQGVEVFGFGDKKQPIDHAESNAFSLQLMAVEAAMVPLSNQVEAFFKKYKEESRPPLEVFSFVKKGQSAPSPSRLGGTTVNILDKEGFTIFQQCLGGQDASYLSLLNQLWPLYAQRSQALLAEENSQAAQEVIAHVFSKDSVAMLLYQQVAAYSITFLQLRFATFSLSTFSQSGAQYFLTTELPALDTIMGTMQAAFDAHFSGGADGFSSVKTIKGADAKRLSDNYSSIYTSYAEQRGKMCAQFALDLAESLATRYTPSLALSQPVTKVGENAFNSFDLIGMLSSLEQFYTLGQTALGLLNQITPAPTFGTYQTPALALQALNGWMGSFYVYCALIGQNAVTALARSDNAIAYQNQIVGPQGATQSPSPFYSSVTQLLAPLQRYYQKAAYYYSAQLDATSANAYAQFGSYTASGISYWSKAEACLANNDFAGAVSAYQTAASCFNYGGNSALSSVLTHRTDAVTLSDYQLLLQSYTQYYQVNTPLTIASFVSQMTTPLSEPVTAQQVRSWHSDYPNGFVQLFYYDAAQNKTTVTPTFQGIAWLAGQAAPVFSHMLNAYQTDTSPTGMVIKQYLQNSLVIVENLVQAAESMFYNQTSVQSKNTQDISLLPQSMAADENLGSGTARGVVEGALQYIKIYEKFSKVDAVLAQKVTASHSMNGVLQLPFQGLFSGVSISGFAQFSLLAQIYWSLMNSDSCLELLKQYPDYVQTVVSSAVILAQQAQTLSIDPSLTGVFASGYTAAISDKINTLLQNMYEGQTGLSLLMAEGDALREGAKTVLDYESALACYGAAGLAGNSVAQTHYFETLDACAQWYGSSSATDYPDFYAAALYYRGYLAQQKGWKAPFDSVKKVQMHVQKFTQQVTADVQAFTALVQSGSYDKAIEQVQKFATLQDEMNRMAIRQKREQLCFSAAGVTVSDFMTLSQTVVSGQVQSVMAQIPALVQDAKQTVITAVFPLVPTVTYPQMVDPLANLAQLYLAQGSGLLDGLKAAFTSGKYGIPLQGTYDKIIQSFTKAMNFFGKSDHSEMIVKVQQALTDGTAFAYYSLVIPSDKTTSLLAQYTAPQPSFSGQFIATQTLTKAAAALQKARTVQAFNFVEPKSPYTRKKETLEVFGFVKRMSKTFSAGDVAAQLKKAATAPSVVTVKTSVEAQKTAPVKTSFLSEDEQPDYLLRYAQIDLTVQAQQEKQLALTLPKGVAAASVLSYQDILAQAKKILGSQKTMSSSASDTSLVTTLAVPLYKKFLSVNGYTSDFSTLDQEVERYSKQVTQLVTQGMQCGSAHLSMSCTLQSQVMPDGTEHLLFVTSNAPLQAVPRFQGEYQTALYYYTEYGRFYAYTPQTVQIGGMLFFQLPDLEFTHQAESFKGVMGAYFAQMSEYERVVENCMKQAPPEGMTLDDKQNYSCAEYASLYQTVASAYSWLFSALSGVQMVQQNQGIFWMSTNSFNALNFAQYSKYMNNNARFLVGYPLDSAYRQVLTDISVLSSMALPYARGIADQAILSRMVGIVYENSGDLLFQYQQEVPSADGYPSTAPTNLPNAALNFTVKYPTCALPLKDSIQTTTSFVAPWGSYFQSANFYLKAYTQYQIAYGVNPLGTGTIFASDAEYRRAWGKYVSFLAHAIMQRLALFGRNAFKAVLTNTASGTTFTFAPNEHFKRVLAQGQTYGGSAAQQGFAGLSGGVLVDDNSAIIQNQYAIMKSLLLDALIYCSVAENVTQNQVGSLTQKEADAGISTLGKLLKCAFSYYAPGLSAVRGQTSNGVTVEKSTLVVAFPDNEVSLDKLGTLNIQQLVYLNTFPALVDYCLTCLMGTAEDPAGPFNKLQSTESMFALNNFFSQLYGMLVVLYTQSFLPESDKNDPEKMETDIQTAVQAQEQGMIVNAESYVG